MRADPMLGSALLGGKIGNATTAGMGGMGGWWHPYFFFDYHGVQVLLFGAKLHNGFDFLLASVAILLLCVMDAWVGRWDHAVTGQPALEHALLKSALKAGHATTHFLIMLIVMSFNVSLFIVTVLSMGVAEFMMIRFSNVFFLPTAGGFGGTTSAGTYSSVTLADIQ